MNWSTRLTERLQISYPIIQGGLAYLGYADLAAAVSNAGGLGQITAMSLPNASMLREEIHRMRGLTDRPFGVNLALGMHGNDFKERLKLIVEEHVPVVSITGGDPTEALNLLATAEINTLVLVSSCRQAKKAERLGASAVIVVGNEGGGHLGRDWRGHDGNGTQRSRCSSDSRNRGRRNRRRARLDGCPCSRCRGDSDGDPIYRDTGMRRCFRVLSTSIDQEFAVRHGDY